MRIASAIVMVLIVISAIFAGAQVFQTLILVCGLLLVDEVVVNLLKVSRKHFSYIVSIITFGLAFTFIHYIDHSKYIIDIVLNSGLALNTILLLYLFVEKMDSKKFVKNAKKLSFMMGVIFLIPVCSLSFITFEKNWVQLIGLLFLLNFSVDTGAWFFGKNFGKKKLWTVISPNKTVVGAVGGVIFASVVASVYTFFTFNQFSIEIYISFIVMGIAAQLGDLVESKIKRQCDVKDSSNLIPGHGGIYDRLDSLLFVGPLFILFAKSYL
jgi:phosphatidate cytidylyltransferase